MSLQYRVTTEMTMRVSELADSLLTEKELALAERLNYLIETGKMRQAWTLLEQVLPKFWKEEGGVFRTLSPDGVYRTLYYLDEPYDFVKVPRHMIVLMGDHLQGVLDHLTDRRYGLPLGRLVNTLRKVKQLPRDLASQLLDFNGVYIRAKHLSADPFLPKRLDRRTFSTREAILSLIIMRQLSMRLCDLLREKGKPLPEDWKQINPEWLRWDREGLAVGGNVIPLREHLREQKNAGLKSI